MTPRKYPLLAALGAGLLLTLTACGGNDPDPQPQPTATCGNAKVEAGEQCDDGNLNNNDACRNDCTAVAQLCGNGAVDSGEECDDGNETETDSCTSSCKVNLALCGNGTVDPGETCDDGNRVGNDGCEVTCRKSQLDIEEGKGAALTPPASGTCTVTAGDAGKLFTGYVLMDGRIIKGGQVLVDAAGVIQCAGTDCSTVAGAATATQVECPRGVISPGLINPHDHIPYQQAPGVNPFTDERYEHRHDWRIGGDDFNKHKKLDNGGTKAASAVRWAELRQLISGTTSIAGAGGQGFLVRNLDTSAIAQEGLGEGVANSDTFPLADSNGKMLTTGCDYGANVTQSSTLKGVAAYLPHVGEGITSAAQNELHCVFDATKGGQALFNPRTAVIHGIGVTAREIARFSENATGLIWSPRSNISLYGDTAMVRTYKQMGVQIALGTDWLQSGSMNELRELQCADYLNSTRFDKAFTDEELWLMVTANAADLTDTHEKLGRIAPGKLADLAIFELRTFDANPHRAIITANPNHVVLTMRAGKAMFGDDALVAALNTEPCDTLTVCESAKRVCVSETGKTFAQLQSEAGASAYELFSCGTPTNEPTCVPQRSNVSASFPLASVNGSTVYAGVSSPASPDKDADGIPDDVDNCPSVFNPVRPMDNGVQLDTDGDKLGDVCDPCPLLAGVNTCVTRNPYDDDADGVSNGADDSADDDRDGTANAQDNCPFLANADQADTDGDGIGDACEPPPLPAATIYDLKEKTAAGTYARNGQKVRIEDVLVTALGPEGFFVSAYKDGAYPAGKGVDDSGLYVFLNAAPTVKVGDRVSFDCQVTVYFELLEVNNVKGLQTLSQGNALPPFERVAPAAIRRTKASASAPVVKGARADSLVGVLVELDQNVFVTGDMGNGQFNVDVTKGSKPEEVGVRVDDTLFRFTMPAIGTEYRILRGVLFFGFDNNKIEPRSAEDMVMVAVAPSVASLTPATGYVRVGQTGKTLTVKLSNSYDQPVTVNVTSSAPADLSVPATVTVPALATSATIPLTIVNANPSVTVSASTTVGSAATATVEVIAADAPARIVGVSPETVTLAPNGTQEFTVTIDAPAPAGGASIPVAVDPVAFGTLSSATVNVAAGESTGTVTFTAGASVGTGQINFGTAGNAASSTVTVSSGSPGRVVISEVAVAGPTAASDEFIELYNAGDVAVDLSGMKIQYKSATGTAYISTEIVFAPGTSIAPRSYHLVAHPAYVGTVTADTAFPAAGLGLAAGGGHVRLGPTAMGTTPNDPLAVDTFAWGNGNAPEGSVFATVSTGSGSMERKAVLGSTAESMTTGADATAGNGYDSNNNATDFVVRTTRDPQNAASPAER